MKKTELIPALEAGKIVCIAEWRSGEAEQRNGTKNNVPWEIKEVRHNVEVGGKPLELSQRLGKEQKVEGYKMPFTKGQSVVCVLDLTQRDKGTYINVEISPYSPAS